MKFRSVFGLLFALWSQSAIPQLNLLSGVPLAIPSRSTGIYVTSPGGFTSILNATGNTYNTSTREISLPSIFSIGAGPDTGRIYSNLELKLADDGRFDLVEFDETTAQEECTKEEIEAAIPQLSLELSLEEAEELIGCNARINYGGTDLELGQIITARWDGNTIVLDPTPRSGFTLTSYSIGFSSFLGRPNTGITLSFLEGVLTEYSFSESNGSIFCQDTTLKTKFESLMSMPPSTVTYDQVDEFLDCSGRLVNTSVSSEGIETQYSWSASAMADLDMGIATTRDTVTIQFIDGLAQVFDFRRSESNSGAQTCTVAELSSAHELILVGSTVMELQDLVPCLPNSVSTGSIEGVTYTSYSWRTANINPSIYVTTNRTLIATAEDSYVKDVWIYRN